jgi:hypothetical protein
MAFLRMRELCAHRYLPGLRSGVNSDTHKNGLLSGFLLTDSETGPRERVRGEAMTDATTTQSEKRERSPSFPFIPLGAAVQRLEEYDKTFPRQEPPADRTYLAWGMKGDSSQSQQTLAALKAFGFVEYRGSGPKRPVVLTADGRTYLRAQQESVRAEILRRAALKPKWIAHFWGIWGTNNVPDPIRLDQLVLENGFIENTAPKFLRVYDLTIKFAGLTDSDKSTGEQATDENDFQGVDDETPPDDQDSPKYKRQREMRPGMKEDVFTLKEGDVILQWPETLSAESFQDLEDWTKLLLRKIKRSIPAGPNQAPGAPLPAADIGEAGKA